MAATSGNEGILVADMLLKSILLGIHYQTRKFADLTSIVHTHVLTICVHCSRAIP